MSRAILDPDFSGIPEKPRKNDRWIVWAEEPAPLSAKEAEARARGEEVAPRWTKVPYRASDPSSHASSSDRKTWSSWLRAKGCYIANRTILRGIGYCRDANELFFDGDSFFRDRREGDPSRGYAFEAFGLWFNEWPWEGKQPEEWYLALLEADAWMERSVSGYGLHSVFASSVIVPSFQPWIAEHTGPALYTGNRYLAATGHTLWPGKYEKDSWRLAEEMQLWVPKREAYSRAAAAGAEARAADGRVHGEAHAEGSAPDAAAPRGAHRGAGPGSASVPVYLSDEEVIRLVKRDRKGAILWSGGDPGGLGDSSHSGLDFHLCQKIAFYSRGDAAQIDRVFRESALYREKWEREDYRTDTIRRAIAACSEFYERREKVKAASRGNGRKSEAAGNDEAHTMESDGPDSGEGGGAKEKQQAREQQSASGQSERLWWGLLKKGRGGAPLCCHYNADIVVRWDDAWKDAGIVLDEFANVIRSEGKMPWGGQVKSWTDADSVRAAIWLQEHDVPATPGIMSDVIHARAEENRVHPLRKWLDSLAWDGTKRLNKWLLKYLGAEPGPHVEQAGAWWMGQCVVRIFRPGCQADYTLVLEGPQGLKKSRALRVLAGEEYFTDQISDFASKDSSIDLQGRWIVEIAEFDRLAHKPSVVKAFLTRMEDRFRPPYGRHSQNFPRQCVFAASVNLEEYLSDSTGNRRFWPVKCGEIDLDGLAADREQLWAEAVERFHRQRERRWPAAPGELDAFGVQQAEREERDIWHNSIAEWIDDPAPRCDSHGHPLGNPLRSTADIAVVSEIVTHACGIDIDKQTPSHAQRAGQTMRRLGWQSKMEGPEHKRYRIWLRPGYEYNQEERKRLWSK